MKKVLLFVFAALLACGSCFAAGNGKYLEKLEKSADKFLATLNKENPTPFAEYYKLLEGFENHTEKDLQNMVAGVRQHLGDAKEVKLENFHRFPDGISELNYLIVGTTPNRGGHVDVVFNPNGKIIMYQFTPLEFVPEGADKNKNNKKK